MFSKTFAAVPVVVLLALAGCSSGGDDGGSAPATERGDRCPVPASVVAEAVGHPVDVVRGAAGRGSCAYDGADDASAGARVEIAVRSLRDESFADVLADVERRSGPTVALDDGAVAGAQRGWRVTVGRAVQVGAADDDAVAIVAVTDPGLDADVAGEVAEDLAGEALG